MKNPYVNIEDSEDEADELQEKYSSLNFTELIDRQSLSIVIVSVILKYDGSPLF